MGWQQNMATMAKEQQAGAAASIGPGTGQKNASMKQSPQIATGQVCSKTEQFLSWTIGAELWIKDGNVFVIRGASEGAFTIDLENSQHFFWLGENRSV